MAYPKPHVFEADEQVVSNYCRVLGYPARVRILRLIADHGRMYVHEICAAIPLHQGAISEHLRKLRVAGLLEVEVEGLKNAYSIREAGVARAFKRIEELRFVLGLGARNES